MKKSWMIIASCVLAVSLMTGSAYAKSEQGQGRDKKAEAASTVKTEAQGTKVEVKAETDDNETVTSNTYGDQGHNGYKGLLNAIDNVKDKPAGAVLANLLLTKYNTQLTDEMKAQLEEIKEKDAALSAVADMLEQNGSVTDAVYVQKEAIRANIKNLDSYKKLGKLYEKMGKKGKDDVELYVNGEEPELDVAPIIRDRRTLVPFAAIAAALDADVTWNGEERSVTVTRGDTTVKLFIDSKTAYVNGEKVTLEAPASIVKSRTVVPVRFVSEALDAVVKWEPETRSVVVYEE